MYCLAYVAVDDRQHVRGRAIGRPPEVQRTANDGGENAETGEPHPCPVQGARVRQDVVQARRGHRVRVVEEEQDLRMWGRAGVGAGQPRARSLGEGLCGAGGHAGEQYPHGGAEATGGWAPKVSAQKGGEVMVCG